MNRASVDPGLLRVVVLVVLMATLGFYSVALATSMALHGAPLG